jgi:hypothetical protein
MTEEKLLPVLTGCLSVQATRDVPQELENRV